MKIYKKNSLFRENPSISQWIFMFIRSLCSFTLFCIGLIISVQAYAVISVTSPSWSLPGNPPTDINRLNVPATDTASNFIGNIIAWGIGVTAVLTILAITWAGIQMVLAVWEEEKMKKARHTMIYAFIWLIIAWLAYGIAKFVTNLNLGGFL